MRSRDGRHGLVVLATLGALALSQSGCGSASRDAVPPDFARAERAVEPADDAGPDRAAATGELIGPDDPDIQAALKAWKDTGQAPIIRKDEFIQYPYALIEAIVTCQPLRVCDIELEAGEEVMNVSLGDSTRWLASPAFSGDRDALTPHVLVKPTELGIATNAVITTSRRTYYLALVSPTKPNAHARRVKFYYPQDLVQQAAGIFRAKAVERKRDQEATVGRLSRVAVDALNFNYQIDGASVPWRPIRVFDDGTRVYIQMPEAMRVTEAPALLVQTRTGDTALVNYRLRQRYYVVDKLFDTAMLIAGVGPRQERVTIRRGAPIWSEPTR
jgi:P-type conjugative transfer protein TrbG